MGKRPEKIPLGFYVVGNVICIIRLLECDCEYRRHYSDTDLRETREEK